MTPVSTDQHRRQPSKKSEPVIVGVDGSWRQTGAVEWALDEALRTGTPLHVLHVVDTAHSELPQLMSETVDTAAQDLVAAVAERAHETIPGEVTASALCGEPGRALAKSADEAGMLVVGRHGDGYLSGLLLGSTAESAVAGATVPVVVVPDDWKPAEHRGGPVVVGVDADANGSIDDTLMFAFESATVRSVPVHIVYAWDLPHRYTGQGESEAQRREREKWQHFDDFVALCRAKYPDVEVNVVMLRDDPVDALVRDARSNDAQLIVVGGRPHGRLASILLGSVTRGVLHHATCPVAVVHSPS
jgi:nucleotide-binding universal stress UspA family protein